jgi:hypothetical protein
LQVIWSDETKISIFGSDGINYMKGRPGEELLHECTTVTMKHPVKSLVWGCMSRSDVGRLHIIRGTLKAEKYQETILKQKLLPSIEDLFPENSSRCIFQEDNAPYHTAKMSQKWFLVHKIRVFN